MKAMQHAVLASILAIGSMFANVATAKEISSPAKTVENVQMSSQQELVALFFAAAKTGNHEVIHEFLKYGFPVDVRNSAGFTPLMMATYYGHQTIVTTLLNHGQADRAKDHSRICQGDWSGKTAAENHSGTGENPRPVVKIKPIIL